MKKLTLLVGIGIGYVLGARAGRQRYEDLKAQAQRAWQNPAVQERATQVQEKANEVAHTVTETVGEKVSDAVDEVRERVQGGGDDHDDAPRTPGGAHVADVPDHGPHGATDRL
ncbi:YtxH domain-containing protein [Nocardioides zeae]|uniref:YtxH domain-containing protein n=1 Tax=Nocardioides imazamoxiresistens TaxID=3231893 RepID=A0ABU3PT21_9ACTN|nr:YtxH domain-containing protein [Nocardioides zeae]MDT9592382.1 YtxH domain-containing protein [Nocardioides zeae]